MRRFIIIIGVAVVFTGAALGQQADSLGLEKRDGLTLVIHRVSTGQTLYGLSKRYGVNVEDILRENPLLENEIKVGQVIKVPLGGAKGAGRSSTMITHRVRSGENLYRISLKYAVSVEQIRRLNGLQNNNIAVGQLLKIKKVNRSSAVETPAEKQPSTAEVAAADQEAEMQNTSDDQKKDSTQAGQSNSLLDSLAETDEVTSAPPFKEVVETGLAELIEEDSKSNKFLALHKYAPVGTVIKVKNKMNPEVTVYVRVVGKIPDTGGNKNVLIKINKRAYDQLKALDKRFLVELSYFL